MCAILFELRLGIQPLFYTFICKRQQLTIFLSFFSDIVKKIN